MTDIQKGLSQSEADEKIRRGECNGSFSVKSKSVGRIFADNIFTLFNLINVIIAVLVALVGAYRNMLFMGVILCNIAIGIFQEIRSKRIIDRLSVISAPKGSPAARWGGNDPPGFGHCPGTSCCFLRDGRYAPTEPSFRGSLTLTRAFSPARAKR